MNGSGQAANSTQVGGKGPRSASLARRRILVIEDDRELRQVLNRAALCFDPDIEVDFVECADEAIQRMMQPRAYDLVLADFMLPESRSGFWLQPHCDTLQPRAVFAMMSSMPLRPGSDQTCPFLRKPFTVSECAEFMRTLLD